MKSKLKLLSKDEKHRIHTASLDLLESVGVLVDHEETRNRLKEIGANVNHEKIVKFPQDLVTEFIKKAPSSLVWMGRDPKDDLQVGGSAYPARPKRPSIMLRGTRMSHPNRQASRKVAT